MVRVRPAIIADAPTIARIDTETWRSTYAGILPTKYLTRLGELERRRMWSGEIGRHAGDVLVALDGAGRVRGFGSCGVSRDGGFGFAGEVFTLYVTPDHQGFGMGRELLLALFARLLDQRLASALVWVLRANPSRFFYERLGGKLVAQRKLPFAGTQVDSIAYGWRDLAQALQKDARAGGRLSDDR